MSLLYRVAVIYSVYYFKLHIGDLGFVEYLFAAAAIMFDALLACKSTCIHNEVYNIHICVLDVTKFTLPQLNTQHNTVQPCLMDTPL